MPASGDQCQCSDSAWPEGHRETTAKSCCLSATGEHIYAVFTSRKARERENRQFPQFPGIDMPRVHWYAPCDHVLRPETAAIPLSCPGEVRTNSPPSASAETPPPPHLQLQKLSQLPLARHCSVRLTKNPTNELIPIFWRRATTILRRVQIKEDGWRGNRTPDTRIFSPLLYQLSYPAVEGREKLPGTTGNDKRYGGKTSHFSDGRTGPRTSTFGREKKKAGLVTSPAFFRF